MDGWYAFRATGTTNPGVVGMAAWLEAPAGLRGPVLMTNDHFVLGDGTRIKFWGVNLGNRDCCPGAEAGAYFAARCAKYGINCVRLHKFINPGDEGIRHSQYSDSFDARALDDFDAFTAQLKAHGVYYGFSHSYHFKIRPGDRTNLLAYNEILNSRQNDTLGLINVAPDVQNVMIKSVIALLRHTNAYTGVPYAADPALAFIEMQNEDDVFFFSTTEHAVNACPTYREDLLRRYSGWLQEKYGTQAALESAWGPLAFNRYSRRGEQLERANIDVVLNGWFMGPKGLQQGRETGTYRRLLDNAQFLHSLQTTYYGGFETALRAVGYVGPLIGSCWQGSGGITHFYNLHADYAVGLIDRHNYFGGMGGYAPRTGAFNNDSQLRQPGGGLLSSGLQQVRDRPFALSEWASVFPNMWAAESPVLIAAYGLGLQGWDASYAFASSASGRRYHGWASALQHATGLWLVDVPHHIGLYPALARMIYRGDVREGALIAARRVALEQLRTDSLDFSEEVRQEGDFKEFQSSMPIAAVAAGRVAVEFVAAATNSTLPNMSDYVNGALIRANNGQLAWDGDKGYFVINTPGTKGVVGFAGGGTYAIGDVRIKLTTPFAVVLLTSLSRDKGLDEAGGILVVAMARVFNRGMQYNTQGTVLEKMGDAPLMLEPVNAVVTIGGREIAAVHVVDHDGLLTNRKATATRHQFTIDGTVDKTMYYAVQLRPRGRK